jgi:AraC-like DNA-binding protein
LHRALGEPDDALEAEARLAAGVGFYDQAQFSRQFTRHVGTPPGRYALSA